MEDYYEPVKLESINSAISVEIKLLSEFAKVPERKTSTAAGYDLFAAEDFTLAPLSSYAVATDIAVAISEGYYGRIAPRSGLAFKNGIDVFGGVIDSDYRGNIKVILFNSKSHDSFKINKGDRIAQIIFEAHYDALWKTVDTLEGTARGEGGFGSTGSK